MNINGDASEVEVKVAPILKVAPDVLLWIFRYIAIKDVLCLRMVRDVCQFVKKKCS